MDARRTRLLLLSLGTLAIVAAAAVLLLARPGGSDGAGTAPGGFAGSLRPDVPTAGFALRDQDGRLVRLRDYRGRVVVVTFLYTSCRDICPLIADQIRGALADLGGPAPPVLAVSVDPAGDTRASARRFVARHGLAGRMRYLLGTRAQLRPVWRTFGVAPQSSGAVPSDHSAYVVLLDRRLRQRVSFPIAELTPEALAHDIRRLTA